MIGPKTIPLQHAQAVDSQTSHVSVALKRSVVVDRLGFQEDSLAVFSCDVNRVHVNAGMQSFLKFLRVASRVHGRPTPSKNIRPSCGVTLRVTRLIDLLKRLRNSWL
jgi:hypothetical protein